MLFADAQFVGCGDSTHRRKFDLDVIICKSLQVTKKGKASDFINLEEQASNSRAAVERLSENAGNVAEAPPVADKARRCWRKTRSIAPAPRAIGDYVLRVARAACFASRSLACLNWLIKHCGAAIGSLIMIIN